MSIKTEIVNTLKKLLGVYEAEAFGKVYSDSEIKISQLEVGGKVELIGVDGELTLAEDGDYELDNGTKFTVKDGQIASIEGQEAPAQEEPVQEEAAKDEEEEQPTEEAPVEEPTSEEQPAQEAPVQEEQPAPVEEEKKDEEEALEEPAVEEGPSEVEVLKGEVDALKQTIAALAQALEELKGASATKDEVNQFSQQVQEMDSNIKKLAKVPVEFSKTTSNNLVKDSKEDKLQELVRMYGPVRK